MPKKGMEKQVPADQRARGLNPEHREGQANQRNQAGQTGGVAPTPKPKKDG
jgi:hypothetical protein